MNDDGEKKLGVRPERAGDGERPVLRTAYKALLSSILKWT